MTREEFFAADGQRAQSYAERLQVAHDAYASEVAAAAERRDQTIARLQADDAALSLELAKSLHEFTEAETAALIAAENAKVGLDKDGNPVKPAKGARKAGAK